MNTGYNIIIKFKFIDFETTVILTIMRVVNIHYIVVFLNSKLFRINNKQYNEKNKFVVIY